MGKNQPDTLSEVDRYFRYLYHVGIKEENLNVQDDEDDIKQHEDGLAEEYAEFLDHDGDIYDELIYNGRAEVDGGLFLLTGDI